MLGRDLNAEETYVYFASGNQKGILKNVRTVVFTYCSKILERSVHGTTQYCGPSLEILWNVINFRLQVVAQSFPQVLCRNNVAFLIFEFIKSTR